MGLKPDKLVEQELGQEIPNPAQYESQFLHDMKEWASVVSKLPEDVQLEIDGLLLQAEEAEHVDTDALRQLAAVFKNNAKDEAGQKIGVWIKTIADFGDFFPRAVDIIVDSHLGDEPDDEEEVPGK